MMKRISAFVSPQRISEVKNIFEEAGYPRNTVHYSYLSPKGWSKGRVVSWQGNEYVAVPIEKIKLELTVADKDADNVRRILIEKAGITDSSGPLSCKYDYALIPQNKISKIKESKEVQYADVVGKREPFEVVQINL